MKSRFGPVYWILGLKRKQLIGGNAESQQRATKALVNENTNKGQEIVLVEKQVLLATLADMILQSMPSRWLPLVSILAILLLLSACSTQKPFYSFATSSKIQQEPPTPLLDSVTAAQPAAMVTTPVAVPESYPLLASTATPALPLVSSQPRLKEEAVRPLAMQSFDIPVSSVTQSKKVSPQKMAPKEEKTPNTKGIHTLVTLGIFLGFVSLVLGLIGLVTVQSGGTALIVVYLLTALAGIVLSARALSKIKASPDSTVYEKDRKAAKLGLLLSLVPAVLILLLALAGAVG